jgi:hypothetical protein
MNSDISGGHSPPYKKICCVRAKGGEFPADTRIRDSLKKIDSKDSISIK